MDEEKKSFWATLPGILTGAAALISAIGGSFVLFQPGNNKNHTEQSTLAVDSDPRLRVVGHWTFTMHSNVGAWTRKGNLTLEINESGGPNDLKGHIDTFNSDWGSFSGEVAGTFNYSSSELILSRETEIQGVIQYYNLHYYSENKISGTYQNNDQGVYKDSGTFLIDK